MKRLYNIGMTLAAVASLCAMSCSEGEGADVPDFSSTVTITSSTINHTDARVWKSNDRVGIYQFSGSDLTAANIEYCNAALDGETAIFKAVNNDEGIEYISGKAEVLGYYPYNADVTDGLISLDLSTQLNAEAVDLVVADRTTLTEGSDDTSITFEHKLAMLRFYLKATGDATTEDLFDVELSISGIYVTGEYDLIAGAMSFPASTSGVTSVTTADGGATIELIVLPQSVGDVELAFQGSLLGRNVQSVTIDGSFATASVFEYDVDVSKTEVTISAPTITPWADSNLTTDGDSVDITNNSYFDVAAPEVGYYYYADGTWSAADDLASASLGGINPAVGIIYHIDEVNSVAYILSIEAPFAPCNWADDGFYYVDDSATDTSNTYNTGVNTYEANTGAQNMAAVEAASKELSDPASSDRFNGYPAFQLVHALNDADIDYATQGDYGYWYMTNTAEAKVALAWIIASWDDINAWFDAGGRSNGSAFPTYAVNRYWGAADEDGSYNTYSNGEVDKYRTMSIYPTSAYAVTSAQQVKSVVTNYTLPIMQIQF